MFKTTRLSIKPGCPCSSKLLINYDQGNIFGLKKNSQPIDQQGLLVSSNLVNKLSLPMQLATFPIFLSSNHVFVEKNTQTMLYHALTCATN